MTTARETIGRAQARRIALAAQGFGARAPAAVNAARLRALFRRLGAVQIDSVNVLVRSQYLPAFSRLGDYDRGLLDRMAYARPRDFFEYWGHEASLLPLELFPMLRWRMERARRGLGMWDSVARISREKRGLVARVRETIAERGAMSASDLQSLDGAAARSRGGWWGWTDAKRAVEFLFWCGELTTLHRRNGFERVYELTERVIPAKFRDARIDDAQACAALVDVAARACSVASEADLRDYFRLPAAQAHAAIASLVQSGRLRAVRVEGWKQQAYLHADARLPRGIKTSALLSPFDSLVWNRDRVHRLFDFHYRLEIYTPAHKRVHGYYVLPYLLGDALVARVDVKADRGTGMLLVHAVHYEPAVKPRVVRERLHRDLERLASWLGLERVKIAD